VSKNVYSRIGLIRHHLICHFTQFITFLSVPAESLSFVYISVRLIQQSAQFATSFHPSDTFFFS